jgi:predicted esterase
MHKLDGIVKRRGRFDRHALVALCHGLGDHEHNFCGSLSTFPTFLTSKFEDVLGTTVADVTISISSSSDSTSCGR